MNKSSDLVEQDRPNKLANADTTWLETITFSAAEHTVTVALNVPMDPTATSAEFEEVIDFDEPNVPPYLREASSAFTEAAVRYVREREAAKVPEGREVRCVECTGACCGRVYNEVQVSPSDAARMGQQLVKRGVKHYPGGLSWTGYVGMLSRIPWSGEGDATEENDERPMACIFLDTKSSLCTIYDVRPDICREHTAHDCDVSEPASPQLIKLRRKLMTPVPAGQGSTLHSAGTTR